MSEQSVSLKVKSTVALPQNVILPMALARRYGIDRRLTISKRAQEVPSGVGGWLRNDARYADWFEDDVPSRNEVSDAQTVETPEKQSAKAETQGGQKAESPNAEAWSTTMIVPQLRDYAKRHGVELSPVDLRDDIIAKLKAAGLPES